MASASELSRRRPLADTDITRNQVCLLKRNVEFRVIGEFQDEDFLHSSTRRRYAREFREPADAMLKVNNRISFNQFAEINLSAAFSESFRALQTAPPMSRKSPKQLRTGKNHKVACRKTKSACKRSFLQLDSDQRQDRP